MCLTIIQGTYQSCQYIFSQVADIYGLVDSHAGNNQLINGRYFAVQNCRFRIHFIINLISIYRRITGAAKVPREASQQSDRACAGEQGPRGAQGGD